MNMYSEAAQVFTKAIKPIAFFIAARFVVTFIEEYFELSASTIANLLIESGIAWVAYSQIIKGEVLTDPKVIGEAAGTFIWRFAVLFIVPVLFALPVLIFTEGTLEESIPPFVLAFVILVFVMVSLFGTQLAAIVDGGDTGWGAAWRRGRQTFVSVFGRLIVGPLAVMVAAIGIGIALGIPAELVTDGVIQWAAVIFFVPFLIPAVYASVMIAVIVTRAYRRSEAGAAVAA